MAALMDQPPDYGSTYSNGFVTITVVGVMDGATTDTTNTVSANPQSSSWSNLSSSRDVEKESAIRLPPVDDDWIVDLWDEPPILDGPRALVTLKARLRYPVGEL